MKERDPIDSAIRSFSKNRRIAERNLADMREYARRMMDTRHGRAEGLFLRILLWPLYVWDKNKLVPKLRETRWKVHFYRRIEADLKQGNLVSAIEALSMFAPQPETTAETVRRALKSPPTTWAVQRGPHIMRVNMLRLRQDLINFQRERGENY